MKSAIMCAVILAFSTATALAQGSGIAKDTTTSMGTPMDSPSDAAPRSATVPSSAANLQARAEGLQPSTVAKCDSFDPTHHCAPQLPPQPGR